VARGADPPFGAGVEEVAGSGRLRRAFLPLRHRGFAIFWTAGLISNTFSWLSALAVPFVLFQLTGSALWVAAATVAEFLPSIALGPVAGALADRFDRRRLLLVTQGGAAISAVALWIEWIAGVDEPLWLLAPVLAFGAFEAVNLPAWQAIVPDLLPRDQLRSGVSVNSMQYNASRAIGPAVAGLLLATVGVSWVFLLNATSFVAAVALLVFVRPVHPQRRSETARHPLRQFARATRHVLTRPGLLIVVVVSALFGLFGNPVYSLTIILAEEVLRVDPVGLGFMNAMLGLGSVIGAAVLTWTEREVRLSRAVAIGIGGLALCLFLLGFVSGYGAVLALLFAAGVALIWMMAGVNTALQLMVPDASRGRAIAVRITALRASIPLGALMTGYIAEHLGVQWSLTICGIAIGAVLLVLFLVPRGIDRLDDPPETGEQREAPPRA